MSEKAPSLGEIFSQALELDSPGDRARYVALACGEDQSLRKDVERLLAAFFGDGDALESPVMSTITIDEPRCSEGPGAVIGPYKLLERIGEGGMGVVYLAEQTIPLRRRVALKIIKPGMDSRQVIARFEAERQALALMDHPNVAKVFDAGTTQSGLPYFVMELVRGISITRYCDQVCSTPRERVELLELACHAIRHAHQKGIIHRDIKPSNVLVSLYDGKPVPKVIDFGVAKATEQRLTERTLYTHHGAIVGTLEYMSPEQADGCALDVDTRTDVYSLGVLLYELMTGTTPLDRKRLNRAAGPEILRRIREEEPPPLSTRLSQTAEPVAIAARRRMAPARLARLLRGEIDWIARKALEKEPNRRYATANDLARDLRRYLNNEPLEAVPPSMSYRVRKFARKHRAALATAAALAAMLIIATAVSLWQAIRATREESHARGAELEARAVLEFFREKVLAAIRPKGQKGGLGRDVPLRAAIDAAEPSIAFDFSDRPTVEASIRETLGTTFLYGGDPKLAVRQFDRARALRAAAQGPIHPDTLRAATNLAVAYRQGGRTRDAIQLLEELLATRRTTLKEDDPALLTTINNLGLAYQDDGRFADAIPLHEWELEHTRIRLAPDHPDTLISMNNLATAYQLAGKVEKSLPLLEETLRVRRTKLEPDHPDVLTTMNNFATALQLSGEMKKAITLFEQVVTLRVAKLGPTHIDTLASRNNLALAQSEAGRPDIAMPIFEEVLKLRRGTLAPDHRDILNNMNSLAACCLETKRWPEAEKLLRECLELRTQTQPDDWRLFLTMSQLGAALAAQAKRDGAENLLIRGYDGLAQRLAKIPDHRKKEVHAAGLRLVQLYESCGKSKEAAEWRGKIARHAKPPG